MDKSIIVTFSPCEDKVTIINKFASDIDDANNVNLDSILKSPNNNVFIKIDVEGAERKVLAGATELFDNNKIKLTLCTYHKAEDHGFFKNMFEQKGYKTETTDGYMLFPMSTWLAEAQCGKPTFRKGILRCWLEEYYPRIQLEKSSLYEKSHSLKR